MNARSAHCGWKIGAWSRRRYSITPHQERKLPRTSANWRGARTTKSMVAASEA